MSFTYGTYLAFTQAIVPPSHCLWGWGAISTMWAHTPWPLHSKHEPGSCSMTSPTSYNPLASNMSQGLVQLHVPAATTSLLQMQDEGCVRLAGPLLLCPSTLMRDGVLFCQHGPSSHNPSLQVWDGAMSASQMKAVCSLFNTRRVMGTGPKWQLVSLGP